MSGRKSAILLIGAAVLSISAFWFLTSPGLTQDNVFGYVIAPSEMKSLSCPAGALPGLIGQGVREVHLVTPPHPYEIHMIENELAVHDDRRRLQVGFDANGTVTDMRCG